MMSPEMHESQHRLRYLPKLEIKKYHNFAPLQAFLDGYINLKVLTYEQAISVFESTRNDSLDILEQKKLKKDTIKVIFSRTQGIAYEQFEIPLHYKMIDKVNDFSENNMEDFMSLV